MQHLQLILFLSGTLAFFAVPPVMAEPVLVVKKSFPLNSITKVQASSLWLAKTKAVGKLKPIYVVDLRESDPLRTEFYNQIVGITGRELEIYWDKMLFSGKVVKPKTVATESDVIQMVSNISGVIGYIDRGSLIADLKILTIKE
jgi:hypothetical protein